MQRGSFTVWIDEAAAQGWINAQLSGCRGASCLYSDAAITTALLLKAVYRLPLRATQGLLASLLQALGLSLPVPHYSTLCRRQASLQVAVSCRKPGEALHLVVDSTGCKVYGEGEWKVRQHGWSKRRTWRKLHVGVDEKSGEIVAAVLSTNTVSDGEVLPELLEQVPEPLCQVSGDGIYDQRKCYEEDKKHRGNRCEWLYHHGRVLVSGSTATAHRSVWHETRTCGAYGRWGVSSGSSKVAITGAASLRPPSHVTRGSWVKSCEPETCPGRHEKRSLVVWRSIE